MKRGIERIALAGALAAWLDKRGAAERGRSEADELRRERDEARARLRRREDDLRQEQQLVMRLNQSRRAEREWNRELRSQLQRFHDRAGILSADGDVRSLVLEAACRLLEAEKGLLLASTDVDGDGLLDLAVSRGFEADPRDSALAQRFARIVLERDETVREAAPRDDPDAEWELTAADREIDNLVAIPLYLRDRFHGVVVCANREGGFREVDDDLLLALGDHAGSALHTSHLRMDLREAHQGAVQMLLEASAARDVERHRQTAEAAALAGAFADELELDAHQREAVVLATLLRDVGFLTMPEGVLQHPGALSPDERAIVELHPRTGFMVLRRLPVLREVAYAVLYHHERHDGAGYPFGLPGDEVPETARCVALLDAFSAMTHDRPYREALSFDEACSRIADESGAQFDPELAARFSELVRRRPLAPHADAVDSVLEAMTFLQDGDDPALLGTLTAADLDPLTGAGGHRAFRNGFQELVAGLGEEDVAVLIMIQLEELTRLNRESGHLAGDRLLQAAARIAERAASRVNGAAYRVSGRRFAIAATCALARVDDVVRDVELEFLTGPTVRTSVGVCSAGTGVDDLVARTRAALGAPDPR